MGKRVPSMVAVSLLLHGVAFASLATVRRAPVHERIEIEVVRRESPPPRAEPPATPPRAAGRRTARADPRPAPSRSIPPPTPVAPPPGAAPQEPPAAAPLPRVGISLGSTVSGGGFAVAVGNTLYGRPAERAEDPATVRPLVAAARLSRQPTPVELPRIEYPADARKAGVEGRVLLVLGIDSEGRVGSARVLEAPTPSLARAALEGARRFRFSPALLDGAAVPTEIRFTYTFQLE